MAVETAHDARAGDRDLLSAVAAGVLSGVVFGLLLQFALGRMTAIGALYTLGEPSLSVGWLAHLFHSALFAAVFALVTTFDPLDRYVSRPVTGGALGAGYGFVLWFVNIGLVWPLWLNAVNAANAPEFPFLLGALQPLVGHLIWGALFGGLYARLR